MAFTGKYELEKEENGDAFHKTVEIVHSDPVLTEIVQNGDEFTMTTHQNDPPITNTFTLNKEFELTGPTGKNIKATAIMLGDKVITQYLNVLYTAEIVGDKLIEHFITSGEDGASMKRVSKRI